MTRLKAALALALAPQSEESEILALVDPIARKQSAPADVRAMASFLQVFTHERRRLRESATAARTSLRDERRALEAQKQRADAMQERAAQLQQKLDALTELEKSLSERSPPSR
jgi:septal ring factor EnvC (AmiA/AmiB activator)